MKTVLITGVSRGIGKALAKHFLSEGYSVIGTSTKGTTDIVHENLTVFRLNLADPASIETCASQIIDLRKPIDILVNNAGAIWPDWKDEKIDMDILRKVLETDLVGPIDFTFRILPIISLGGHIVNVSSRQGSLAYAHARTNMSYQIAKAGLNMFTRSLSFELKDKITVSTVHPGAVLTDMAAPDASMSPEESASYLYDLAISQPESGRFWFKGESFPW